MNTFDVLIVGAGPAGTGCALALAKRGKKVGLIEKDAVGGVCLNRGCIPSKTYLYIVELLEEMQKAGRFGIRIGEPQIAWEEVKKRKDSNVRMLGAGLTQNLTKAGVQIIHGQAAFKSDHELIANGEVFSAAHIVLAAGSESAFMPNMQRGEHIISSTEILDLQEIPKSLTIIGGGVTGAEMASIFAGLGTKITIIELGPVLLAAQDREISAELKKALEKKGCTILIETQVVSCKDEGSGAVTVYKTADGKEETLVADKSLVVIGRVLNRNFLESLGGVGVKHDGKRIELNGFLQTSAPHIYVIGDSAFRNLTAYCGEREGECVAAHICGEAREVDYANIPVTVFSHPEVGAVGLTEEEAKAKGIDYELIKNSYGANAKALIMGAREGLVKMIVERGSQKILGVHIVGAHACELIHQAILPVMQELTVPQWREVIFSHPVLSEVLKLK